jgi:carboxymethylenebutenolidase
MPGPVDVIRWIAPLAIAVVAGSAAAATAVPSVPIRALIDGSTVAASGRTASGLGAGPRSDTARVQLGSGAAATSAFVAYPPGDPGAPGVIVVHEWWGLNHPIREVARRLAREGYVVIVPDLYHGKQADGPERAHELSRGLEESRALADLRAAARWLGSHSAVAGRPIGVVGFGMGGGLGQAVALDTLAVAAAVSFHGAPITDSTRLAGLDVPLQAHFGAADEGIPMTRLAEFRSALQRLGKPAEIHVYPGAGHGFMNETRPSYHADAARQAWARTLAFLQRHLKKT